MATWSALGTYVQLVVDDARRLDDVRAEAERLLEVVDRSCSRFRDDADLVRANRAAGQWVSVDPMLPAAVAVAIQAAEETEGLVDPTLGRSLVAVGYDRDLALVQSADNPAAIPLPAVPEAWRAIETDPAGAIKVPFGVALDLGATGKAFAADLIADRVVEILGVDLVISLGGDVAVGRTDPGVTHQWEVEVSEEPGSAQVQSVVIESGGLATSSIIRRRWTQGGRTMHHLLDPRTGRPVEHVWRTVTVAASTCVAANTSSTAAIVLGELAPDWLQARGVPARLVSTDGAVLCLGGWPEEEGSWTPRA
jgi:thiamine biosynthesis lipoprotein